MIWTAITADRSTIEERTLDMIVEDWCQCLSACRQGRTGVVVVGRTHTRSLADYCRHAFGFRNATHAAKTPAYGKRKKAVKTECKLSRPLGSKGELEARGELEVMRRDADSRGDIGTSASRTHGGFHLATPISELPAIRKTSARPSERRRATLAGEKYRRNNFVYHTRCERSAF